VDHDIDIRSEEFQDNPGAAFDIGYSWNGIRTSAVSREVLEDRDRTQSEKDAALRESTASLREIERANLREMGIDPEELPKGKNSEAYREIENRARQKQRQGQPLIAAVDSALSEPWVISEPMGAPEREPDGYLGASIHEIAFDRKGNGGGGGGSSKSREKSFPKRCRVPECFLQYCDHRDTGSKGGRKPLGAEPKSRRKSIRITPAAEAGFTKAGISEGTALEILGQALLSGKSFEEVRASLPGSEDAA
jgi:hypothetical protein